MVLVEAILLVRFDKVGLALSLLDSGEATEGEFSPAFKPDIVWQICRRLDGSGFFPGAQYKNTGL